MSQRDVYAKFWKIKSADWRIILKRTSGSTKPIILPEELS